MKKAARRVIISTSLILVMAVTTPALLPAGSPASMIVTAQAADTTDTAAVSTQTAGDTSASTTAQMTGTAVKTGLQKENGGLYYYDQNGVLKKGWQTIDGKKYYFDKKTGAAVKGLKKISKKYYYFDKKTGAAVRGWQKISKKYYYFDKKTGAAVKGWQKIGKKYYYFNKKTYQMAANTIAGSKKEKYYYVGEDGARVNTKEMNEAVKFVLAHSSAKKSDKKRLEQCFRYLARNYKYKAYWGVPTAKEMPSFAYQMFKYKAGDCNRFAISFAYIAKALGYDSRVCLGAAAWSKNGTSYCRHCWTEVKVGKKWYICDASRQSGIKYWDLFLNPDGEYPFSHKRNDTLTLTAAKGKVIWK